MTGKQFAPEVEDAIQKALNLGGLVSDWGGFEKLVAELNATGNVTVEHDVKLTGKSGAPRQIDVLIRHQEGLIEHLVIIDCKHWKERVSRVEVDALATSVRELNASRGVLFSVMGFESGAVTQAKADGIKLFTVRELTDKEWGLPGRYIDFYLTCIAKAVRNVMVPGATASGFRPAANLNLAIGDPSTQTKTPIMPRADTKATDLETLLEGLVHDVAQRLWHPQVLFGGVDGTRSFWQHADIDFQQQPVVVPTRTSLITIPKVAFDIGLKIHQKRMQFDRGEKYAFVLAVEDCVRGVTRTAMRVADDDVTRLANVHTDTAAQTEDKGPVFQNGSIISIGLGAFFDFNELADLGNGEYRDKLENS